MSQEQQIAIEERFARVFNDKSFKERLSSADFEKYINAKKKLSFQKHDTIFEDGEIPKGVYVIEKGAAKLSKSGAFGKEQGPPRQLQRRQDRAGLERSAGSFP